MWITLFIILCQLAGALTSVHAVMNVRTAHGAVALAVSLNTFPYRAVPAYWVLGRSKFRGYVIARRRGIARVEPVARQFYTQLVDRNLVAFPDRHRPLSVER